MDRPLLSQPWVPPLLIGEGPPLLSFVGEAPGINEEIYNKPFVGYAGDLLNVLIKKVWSPDAPPSYYLTNVFKIRPEKNSVDLFFGKREEGAPGYPANGSGKYILPIYTTFLESLRAEPPLLASKLIIALGNTALWAFTGRSGISKLRGIILEGPAGLPILPTFHPSAVLREAALRTLLVADLEKARSYLKGLADPDRGKFNLTLNPSLADLPPLLEEARRSPRISVDVETSRGQITVLGFGLAPRRAICIPFWCPDTFRNYWPSPKEEAIARRFCQNILHLPCPKVFHNGMYDIQYLLAEGFSWSGPIEDTMLLHHALQPEMQKSLGFLGATYTDEPEWKSLRDKKDGKEDEE